MQPLVTERLTLREFSDADTETFIALNGDPDVMRCFPAPLSREESIVLLDRLQLHQREHGFGMLALEAPGVAPFIGFAGLNVVTFEAAFTPCVELAWRLLPSYWGFGFATEAATALVRHAFTALALPHVVAFTVPDNVRSRGVMERLGMSLVGEFDHPRLPAGHRLQRHVLYRLTAPKKD